MRNLLYRFGKFQLTTAARELRREGERVSLPRRAYDCILYLIEHRDRAVGRDELTAAVWGRVDVTDAQLSQIMLHARRAVDDSGQAQLAIRTLPGFGYHWIAETEERAGLADDDAEVEASPTGPGGTAGGHPAAAVDENTPPPPSAPARGSNRRAGSSHAVRRGLLAASALLVLLVAVAAAVLLDRRVPADPVAGAGAPSSPLAVLPLEVSGPGDSGWVRLGAMDLIAERLRGAGLAVPPSENVLIALRSAATAGRDTPALGEPLGVGTLVEGKAIQSAEGWTVELAASRGQTQHYTATARHADVIRAARQAADLLLAAMGRAPPPERGEDSGLDDRLQQAQAAMLAGELDTARKILAALPEQEAPRVRLMQALVAARSGRLDEADASYARMIADPAVRADPLLYGRALSNRGWVRVRLEKFAAAESDYDGAVTALQNTDSPIDLARALNGRGGARIAQNRFDEAAGDLGRARIEMQRSGDRLGVIQSDANFGLLEYRRERFEQALPYLTRAADQFEAIGAVERVMGVLTAAYNIQALLWRWPEALAITDRQWKYLDRAGDPGLQLQITANRGEALLMLGRLREARELAMRAEHEHADTRPQARRYLLDLLARIAWARREADAAVAAADRALALWGAEDPDEDRNGAQLVLLRQRALIASGKATDALLDREPKPADPSPFLLVARAERAAWRGLPAEAESAFHRALQQAEARGVPIGLVVVGEAYGRWLLSRQRVDEAAALAGRLAPWADRDVDVAVFQAAVFDARGDRQAAAAALQQARKLAGERELPSRSLAVSAR